MTYKEFIDDFEENFVKHPERRALNKGVGLSCMYKTKDGKKCAIGKWIPDDKYSDEMEVIGSVTSLFNSNSKFKFLKDIFSGLSIEFLLQMQKLHDQHFYWKAEGLTDMGENVFSKIKKDFYEREPETKL